ncbi:uncharacterized protein HD556DRAFT_1267042, partial [Suillus plorans]
VSHLNNAVEHFQLVLDQCPVSHPDHATALTNLAWVHLLGYIRNDLEDIDATTSLFRDALALRPQHHPDHPSSPYNLTEALTWHHIKKSTATDIREAAQLYHELLPLCPEDTYLPNIAAGNGVNYHGSIDDLDTSIQLGREAVSLCLEVHADRDTYLNNLASSLTSRFRHQGKPNDLNEAISLHEEALTLHPPRHPCRDTTLNNLAIALDTRYRKSHVSEDLNEAIGLYRESIRLRRLDLPQRNVTLHNLSSVLCFRFTQTQKNEDVEEAITLCQQ